MMTIVDTSKKIPAKLFQALCLFETYCAVSNKKETTQEEVISWLEKRVGYKISKQFKTEYLYQ